MQANEAYQTAQTEVEMLVHQLQEALALHAMKQAKNPGSWGFVGDIDRAKNIISSLVSSFS